MEEKLDFEQFKDLVGDKWGNYLKPLFESKEMFQLYQQFKELSKKGVRITPKSDELYNFLKYCDPSNLNLIIIGLDSYPGVYKNNVLQCTGFAFDCSNSPDKSCQPSLSALWEGLSHEYNEVLPKEYDIRYLAEREGVLLANRALNCKLYKTGSFVGMWDFWWKFYLEQVITPYFPGIPILFLGNESKKLRAYVFEMNNPVFELTHPSFAARTNSLWETKGVFKSIDRITEGNNKLKINWKKEILVEQDFENPPF